MLSIMFLVGAFGLVVALPLGNADDEDDDWSHDGEDDETDAQVTDNGADLESYVSDKLSEDHSDVAPESPPAGQTGEAATVPTSPDASPDPGIHPVLYGINEVGWSGEGAGVLQGTKESETLTLDSSPVNVFSGEGADTIDASLAESAFIKAASGDVVFGPDNTENALDVVIQASDGAVVVGGHGPVTLISVGEAGADLTGGDGDDLMLSDAGASTLNGGGGDDLLMATSEEIAYGGEWGGGADR